MKEIKVLQGAVTHEGRPDPWGGGKREHGDFRDENPPEIDWMETNPVVGQIDTHPLNTTKNLPEVDWSDTTLDIDDPDRPETKRYAFEGNYYWGNGLGTLDPNFDDGHEKVSIDELEDNTYFVLPFGVGGLHSYLGIDGDDAPKQWGSIFDFMSSRLLDLIANKNGYLLINYTQEGHVESKAYRNLHNELNIYNIPANKVFFVASNLNGKKQYKDFCDRMPTLTKKKMHIIEMNHMLESSNEIYHQILNDDYNKKIDELYPHKQSFVNKKDLDDMRDTIREKYFLCYNRVIREYRLALVAMIYEMGLQDKGIISCGAKGVDSIFGGVFPNKIGDFLKDEKQNELVSNALKKIKPLYPIDADGDIDAEFLPEWGSGAVGQWSNFAPQYKRVYFNVITESCYYEDCIYMSEKVFKPISQLVPFIYLTNPFAMKKLREIGYKTFQPWIDESYDEEVDNDKRFFMILDEIKRLCSMSKEEIHKWYYEMEDILLYNQEHFANYKHQDRLNCWTEISEVIGG